MFYIVKLFTLAALLFLCQLHPCEAAPAGLSFQTARAMLMERSDKLEAAGANVESKKQIVDSQKTLWGPTVSVQAGQLWGETHIDIDRSIKTPLGNMPIDINEYKNFNGPRAAATATWPLFTGGKIIAEQKTGEFALEEAKAREKAVSIEQETRLVGLYFGLQLARALEKVRKEMLDQQIKEVARAKRFEAEGMISKVERMGVEVARDRAERQWLQARDNSRIARIELARMLKTDTFQELSTPLFVLKETPGSLQGWVDESVAKNPQIAALEARTRQADQGVKAAVGNWAPDVYAIGQYSFVRQYQTMVEPTWFAGIGLNLTLWDARGRTGQYKSARATLREAKALKADMVNQVRADAEVAWQNTRNARERYDFTKGNVDLAQENLALKTQGFEEGLSTALEMNNARDQLSEAKVARKVAAYEFVVNYAILHAIAGKMDDFLNSLANKKNMILEN